MVKPDLEALERAWMEKLEAEEAEAAAEAVKLTSPKPQFAREEPPAVNIPTNLSDDVFEVKPSQVTILEPEAQQEPTKITPSEPTMPELVIDDTSHSKRMVDSLYGSEAKTPVATADELHEEDNEEDEPYEEPQKAEPQPTTSSATIDTEEGFGEAPEFTPSKTARMQTQDLQLFYGAKQALHGIDLSIEANSVTALIGPSGCGKSTYLRCLNRMNDTIPGCKISGHVLLDGHDIYAKDVDVVLLRARVGMVFQKPNPFPKSIFDNVAYGPRIHGLTRHKSEMDALVESALTRAGLWDEVKDRLHEPGTSLSGGQQQRLCIARSIAISPNVILMDEPCSALDPIATAKIEDLIAELAENYTIVIVTHSMQQAARVSDTTAFFHMGYVVETGSTEQIFHSPVHQRTKDYITGRFG